MREINEDELVGMLHESVSRAAILFHTPLCGTCKLAERMLQVVEATGVTVPTYKVNMNYAPGLRDDWHISSVPCLALVKDGRLLRLEYAMRSVDHLYAIIRGLE